MPDFSAAEQKVESANGRRDLSGIMGDAMSVHAKRATNTEDVDRLHGLYRQTVRIQKQLNLLPGSAGLRVQNLVLAVQVELIETAHVENEAVLDEGVATHAVA